MSLIVDIKKNFGDFTLRTSLEGDKGVTALLGPSGCGKSVTLRCIAGVLRPDEGYIELNGRVLFDSRKKIDLPPQKRRVGYLFQNYALFPNMTVQQNILCGMHRIKDKAERARRLSELLDSFELRGLEKHYPGQLSGGQAQRTALARILAGEPELLLLDEPFSALDTHLKTRLTLEMKERLAAFGKEVLMVTHSREEAYHLAKDLAVMEKGELLIKKPVKALFADPERRQAAILTGCKNIADAVKTGEYEVFVPDWGIHLTTEKPVREDIKAIGIRAHYFNPSCPRNVFPVEELGGMEEPFEWILSFRYREQRSGAKPIWWRLPKDKKPGQFPETLGVAPANIMQLID